MGPLHIGLITLKRSLSLFFLVIVAILTGDCMNSVPAGAGTVSTAAFPQPYALSATATSSSQIDLSWTDGTDNETGFNIERKAGPWGVYYRIAYVPSDTFAYSDSGLRPDTTYYYRVQAVYFDIDSSFSAKASATTMPSLPVSPENLHAVATSSGRIVLTWFDKAMNESGYIVESRTGTCESLSRWREIAVEPADATSSAIKGLAAGTDYSFRVLAYNDGGKSGYSSCATAKTGPDGSPPSPTNLKAIAETPAKIRLKWLGNAAADTYFKVYRKAGTQDWGVLARVAAGSEEYVDASALGNDSTTPFRYYIEACNSYGCSPPTNHAAVPLSPGSLTVSAQNSANIELSWTDTNGYKTGNQIWRKDGRCSSTNKAAMIADGYFGTSYVSSGLAPGTEYAFKVKNFTVTQAQPYAYGYSYFSACSSAVTVTPALLSITLRPSGPRVTRSDTIQFTAYGNYSDGTVKDMTSVVNWNSSDETKAVVGHNGTDNGLATAIALGSSSITAAYQGISGSATLTIGSTLPANIILILTDDQVLGETSNMPKLNSLIIDQGASFNNFFVTTPLCCPSRTSIMRGQYSHNTHVQNNGLPAGGYSKFYQEGLENSTVATWLQNAGYRTALIGKFLNGYPEKTDTDYVPQGWDEWYAWVAHGHQIGYYNYQISENGTLVNYGDTESDYLTDVLANKAVDFIQRSSSFHHPFFLYLAPFAPHSISAQAYWPALSCACASASLPGRFSQT